MAQAVNSNTTSRRSFLAAAAVAGAVAVPTAATAADHPDAELIRLGKNLDSLVQRLNIALTIRKPLLEKHQQLMREWKASNPRAVGNAAAMNAYERFWEQAGLNNSGAEDADDLTSQIGDLADAILAIPAASLGGLCVKARVAKFAAPNYWGDNSDDLEWDQFVMRGLCDAVIDLAARTAVNS